MTTQEKEILLAFYKEQQRYNEALTAFCQLLCDFPDTAPADSSVPDDTSSGITSPDNTY